MASLPSTYLPSVPGRLVREAGPHPGPEPGVGAAQHGERELGEEVHLLAEVAAQLPGGQALAADGAAVQTSREAGA